MSIIKLYQENFFYDNLTDVGRLQALAKKLWPIETDVSLLRIGSEGDGGYLLPDDFADLVVCFSPGVEFNSSFEASLEALTGIQSHLADFSVDGPPKGFKPRSFLKKFLGPNSDSQHITLEEWVCSQEEWGSPGDFLLQCDIEGGEYLSLLATPHHVLSRFRTIVIEIHHAERWASPSYFEMVESFFEKILANHLVIHNHPNNHGSIFDINGFQVP